MKKKPAALPCPCGSGRAGDDCCLPLLGEERCANDAETLMRSRYAAFTLGDAAYLLRSWHPSTRPAQLELDDDRALKWIGLQIRRHLQQDDDHATVEFIARYRVGGRAGRLHETSRFVREQQQWYYVDGDVHSAGK